VNHFEVRKYSEKKLVELYISVFRQQLGDININNNSNSNNRNNNNKKNLATSINRDNLLESKLFPCEMAEVTTQQQQQQL
jgi:hypothetical protein